MYLLIENCFSHLVCSAVRCSLNVRILSNDKASSCSRRYFTILYSGNLRVLTWIIHERMKIVRIKLYRWIFSFMLLSGNIQRGIEEHRYVKNLFIFHIFLPFFNNVVNTCYSHLYCCFLGFCNHCIVYFRG